MYGRMMRPNFNPAACMAMISLLPASLVVKKMTERKTKREEKRLA